MRTAPSVLTALLVAGSSLDGFAQALKHAGCPDITKADFTKVPLVKRNPHLIDEPIQMVIGKDGKIFWTERRGKVRAWNPVDDAAATLLDLTSTVFTGTTNQIEHGVTGIALDPAFDTNKWVYVFWSVKTPMVFRLSRYTLSGNALTAARTVLEIPYTNTGCCHTGGSMAFDKDGNLFLAVGNTTNNNVGVSDRNPDVATNYVLESDLHGDDQARAANTNSLLGKILRIKPRPIADGTAGTEWGAGKSYDIPAGNLFPVGQYPADKTRPEIFTMGHRNPYSLTVDPFRSWVTWGEIGPDEWGAQDAIKTEEHGLATEAGNQGWPYFVGANQRFRLNKNPAAPTNTSRNNTGLTTLPPAQPAVHPYGHSAAVTGPIYHYDGRLPSKTKLPPHFNKKWIVSDFNQGYIQVLGLSENGKTVTDSSKVWTNQFLVRPLDVEVGPDGNLYVLDYSGWFGPGTDTRIARVEYTGSCLPTDIYPTVGLAQTPRHDMRGMEAALRRLSGRLRMPLPVGMRTLEIFDLGGRKIHLVRSSHQPGNPVEIPAAIEEGLYYVRFAP